MGMNPIRRAFTVANQTVKSWVMAWASARYEWDWFGGGSRSRFDYKNAVSGGTHNSAVMAPILWFARTYPEAKLRLKKLDADGETEDQPKHPMIRLLKRPNKYYSGSLMWMATAVSLLVTGNAYWLKVRNARSQVLELWWTPTSLLVPKWNTDGSGEFITHYEYRPGAAFIDVPVEDVVHFRYGIDPNNIRLGLSPLASALREVFTDDETNNFTSAVLRNLGVPGLIISPDSGGANISNDDANATKAYVQQEFGGDNRGAPLVLKGPTKVQMLAWNPEQLGMRDIYRKAEERITAVLGIPAIVAGLGAGLDRSTFANMAEAREMAYETTVIPIQGLAAEEVETQLLPDFESNLEDWMVEYDYSHVRVLQEDQNKKIIRIDVAVRGGWMPVDLAQREAGFAVDETQHVYLRPQSTVEIPVDSDERPSLLPPAEPLALPPGRAAFDEDLSLEITRVAINVERLEAIGMTAEAADERERLTRLIAATPKALTRRGRKASVEDTVLMRRLAEDAGTLERALTGDLLPLFADLGAVASRAFTSRKLAAVGANGNGHKAEPSLEEEALEIVRQMEVESWVQKNMPSVYEKHYIRAGKLTFDAVSERLGITIGWNMDDPLAQEIVRTGGTRLGLLDIRGDSRAAIANALADGRAAGEGADELADRIRRYVPAGRHTAMEAAKEGSGVQYRAETLARTETKYAQNVSSLSAYRSTDVVTGVVAFDNQTGYGDADCVARNGNVYSLDDADRLTGAEHPRGTLSWSPVVRS